MKNFILALGLSMFAISLYAADTANEPTPQQNKMKACNADAKAKSLAGEDRKKFMSACLSAKEDAAAEPGGKKLTAQQQKMKDCMAKAKGLKGDEFKKTRDDCMKAK